jgi:hypothetical protein
MICGKVEIQKDFENMIVITEMEDGRLLKLNGRFPHAQNVAYLSHHGEGITSSSLLWHASFGYTDYVILRLLRKNGVSGLLSTPRKLNQCDVCILGKHRKQPFHDSTSKACRKLELIHYDFCGPMHVPSANGNKYITSFIDDYTMMCWVYLLKDKSLSFEIFKKISCMGSK